MSPYFRLQEPVLDKSDEKWKALLEEGMVAAHGNPDLLDFMVPYARPGWRERLAKDQEAKAMESTAPKTPARELETAEPARGVESTSEPLVEAPPPGTKLPKINWRKRFW
jgi:hypothetical protein